MDLRLESQYEEAKLTWASKEKQLAVFLLKDLEQKISLALESPATPGVDKQSLKSMHPLVLSKLGKWSLELRSESSSDLLNKYFYKSVKLYEGLPTPPSGGVATGGREGLERGHRVFGAYANLAQFCDAQYQQIDAHMKSKDFEEKAELSRALGAESKSISIPALKANGGRSGH